jgi:ATP-dependent DNA ligase
MCQTALCHKFAVKWRPSSRAEDRRLPLCQPSREEKDTVGLDPRRDENCVWLKPELVAQIEFTEWTPDGHLRHSKFVGLREDKKAREVVRETEG